MATIGYVKVKNATGKTRDVYEDIMRTYGSPAPHGIYMLMGHTPEHLEPSWIRSRYLFGNDSQFTLRDKHIMTLGISATNNCEYCVRIHTSRLKELCMSPVQLTEVMAVVDVTNGLSKFHEGTRAGDNAVIPDFDAAQPPRGAEKAIEQVRRDRGNVAPDPIYPIMANWPEYLKATWERNRMCLDVDGTLGVKLKTMLSYTVAATSGAERLTGALAQRLKELGTSDAEFLEMLLIIDLTCGYNRYVQGLQADQEEKPFGEHAEANKASSVGR